MTTEWSTHTILVMPPATTLPQHVTSLSFKLGSAHVRQEPSGMELSVLKSACVLIRNRWRGANVKFAHVWTDRKNAAYNAI